MSNLTAEGVRWELSDLFSGPDDPKLNEMLDNVKKRASTLAEQHHGKIANLASNPEALKDVIQEYEDISKEAIKPFLYARLSFSINTADSSIKALMDRTQRAFVDVENTLRFIRLEINNSIHDDAFANLLSSSALTNYNHWLEVLRQRKPYQLSEGEEKVIAKKDISGESAWEKLYEELTSSFTFEFEVDGELKERTADEMRALQFHPDADIRYRSMKMLLGEYQKHSMVLRSVLNAIISDHYLEGMELRGFPSTLTSAYLRDEVDEDILKLVMEVVEKNYHLVQEYYKLKASLMGITKIRGSDLVAPIFTKIGEETKFDWSAACQIVLESYYSLDQELGDLVEEMYRNPWIDAEPRPGKVGGAFCSGLTPDLHPLMLQSFSGTRSDVLTLAHELGHALHDFLSAKNQTYFNYSPPLVLAETASTIGEILTFEKLLNETTDPKTKARLLAERIEGFIGTVSRQVAYTYYELDAHTKGSEQTLSTEEHCELWEKRMRDLYGDTVEFLPEQSFYPFYIPHFIATRYYCYTYAFGLIFATACYQKLQTEGKSFIPKLKDLLAKGGSEFPVISARDVGLYIMFDDFWQGGFDYLAKLIEDLREVSLQLM